VDPAALMLGALPEPPAAGGTEAPAVVAPGATAVAAAAAPAAVPGGTAGMAVSPMLPPAAACGATGGTGHWDPSLLLLLLGGSRRCRCFCLSGQTCCCTSELMLRRSVTRSCSSWAPLVALTYTGQAALLSNTASHTRTLQHCVHTALNCKPRTHGTCTGATPQGHADHMQGACLPVSQNAWRRCIHAVHLLRQHKGQVPSTTGSSTSTPVCHADSGGHSTHRLACCAALVLAGRGGLEEPHCGLVYMCSSTGRICRIHIWVGN
jgi:hypothetical protein